MKRLSLHRPPALRGRGQRSDGRTVLTRPVLTRPVLTRPLAKIAVLRPFALWQGARPAPALVTLLAVLAATLTLWCSFVVANQGVPHSGFPHRGAGSGPGPASPDAVLERVDPQPQGWLPEPPDQVTLRFRESLQPAGSAMTVSTSQGRVEGSVAFPDPYTMTFQFRQRPGEGTYFVEWQASLSSGRTAEGRFHFTYLAPAAFEEPLDRREVNRLLGNLLPSWLLWLPAALGVGGLIWGLWSMWRNE